MKEVSAGGVVYRKEDGQIRIQLILDRYGRTTLAKGKMEQGETIEQTALREIEEETGIVGRIVQPLDTVYYEYRTPSGTHVDKEVHYFLVEAAGGEHKVQQEEINHAAWYDADTALQMQLEQGYDNNDHILQKALDLLDPSRLSQRIDHTLLLPQADSKAITKLCEEAAAYQFYSVCVNSSWVPLCREMLAGTTVKISAVCGFPLGASATEIKAKEAALSIEQGASEIDMVIPVGRLIEGDDKHVFEDIKAVTEAAAQVRSDAVVKVILETGLLPETHIQTGCRLAAEAGAHFVKTSTGFGPRGASESDIILMKQSVPKHVQIKASGGIRDLAAAQRMIALGASRLGTSSGVAILQGFEDKTASY